MFNQTVEVMYGSIYFLCFLIGTIGNIVSFLYFKSKKRDISSVIYMMITANDIVVSIMILPVGSTRWSQRQGGHLLGAKHGCTLWLYTWEIAVAISIFYVICLCTSRTISLISPFKKQKARYLFLAVLFYSVPLLSMIVWLHQLGGMSIKFDIYHSCCRWFVMNGTTATLFIILVMRNIVYTTPAIVVSTSCVISAVLLTRRNENVQARELQQSRNRATVTILLFALLYGVCNIPLVVDYILLTCSWYTEHQEWYKKFYKFDKNFYFRNTLWTQLLAINSAANPIFYFWRMPCFRQYTQTGIRRILRLNGETRRPDNVQSLKRGPANRAVQNTITLGLPATATVQTRNL